MDQGEGSIATEVVACCARTKLAVPLDSSKSSLDQAALASSILASFALICSQTNSAMSLTSIAASIADRPSVTMVEQNGQPTATVSAPVEASSFARMMLTRSFPSGVLFHPHLSALHRNRKSLGHCARFRYQHHQLHHESIVFSTDSTKITWVVVGD